MKALVNNAGTSHLEYRDKSANARMKCIVHAGVKYTVEERLRYIVVAIMKDIVNVRIKDIVDGGLSYNNLPTRMPGTYLW